MRRSFVLTACGSLAGGSDVLSKLLAPTTVDEFLTGAYENRWAYFPHAEAVIPDEQRPSLADVTQWASRTKLKVGQDLEMLPHPHTHTNFKLQKAESTVDALHRGFTEGHSMVINSLQDYSESSRRLVGSLLQGLAWPIDAYMYLTPPHSLSYDVHSDVMDAWMLQLHGVKEWTVCHPRPFVNVQKMPKDTVCTNVTMKGGDAMYVPFGTLHKAWTTDELSSHLTVNVERQCFVWANILKAAATHALLFAKNKRHLTPWEFIDGGGFILEGETAAEQWLLRHMVTVPLMSRTPLAGNVDGWSKVLARGLDFADAPKGYWEAVLKEWKVLVQETEKIKGKWPQVSFNRKSTKFEASALPEESLRWAFDVAKIHAMEHLKGDVWFDQSAIGSLATMRTANIGSKQGQSQSLVFTRPQATRVVVIESGSAVKLWVNTMARRADFDRSTLTALRFACGLYGKDTSQGRAFRAEEVPWSGPAAKRNEFLLKLVHMSALEVRNATSLDKQEL